MRSSVRSRLGVGENICISVSNQTADHECESWLVVVLSGRDEIPFLTIATVAWLGLNGSQVLTEIS
jgi:hypothetical protein